MVVAGVGCGVGWVGGRGCTWALAVVVSAMKDAGFFLSSRSVLTTCRQGRGRGSGRVGTERGEFGG